MSRRPFDQSAWQQQWELFHSALELPVAERDRFLDEACPSEAVRRAVARLLNSHEKTTGPLDASPLLETSGASAPTLSEDETVLGAVPRLRRGEILAERFEILGHLGEGGMGAVYEAYDPELETRLAVKILRPEIAASEAALRRFRREIQLARQVTHPNVCRVFDLYRDGSLDFLTMELLDGTTLDRVIAERGPLSRETVSVLIEQVCAALSAAHHVGVVHRDLKPGNIMLIERDDSTRVVVTDFGLARSLERDSNEGRQLTVTGQVLGTPAYMAPEQLDGGPIGPTADIYSLGVILFELVTGRRPFQGDTSYSIIARKLTSDPPSPRTLNRALDRRWERTILRCLERRPEDRFASVTEVIEALSASRGIPIPSRRRHRRRLAALLSTAALLAAITGLWLWPGADSTIVEPSEPRQLTEAGVSNPWVLVADFANETDEPGFDETVAAALRRELSNSRRMRMVPRERVGDTLRLMHRSDDTHLDAATAREVALRDGGIPVLVSGRIAQVDDSYVLSADLIDVAEGEQIGGVNEHAATGSEVLPAVRRLSNALRDALGESEQAIRESNERLEQVTTPSLRALRLYSQADELMWSDPAVSVELLQEAISDDPDFAMAHLLLAHALRNLGRPPTEYQEHVRRAFELSDDVPDREKFFIRGSYHSMHGNWDDAVANYATLVRLHPDHRWVGNNLFNTLAALGRQDEAVPYAEVSADNRPNDFHAQARAALALAQWAGRPDAAAPYLARAARLLETLPESDGYLEAWVETYPAFAAWLNGDVETTEKILDELAAELDTRRTASQLAWFVASGYEALGRLHRASEVDEYREPSRMLTAWIRGDRERLADVLVGRDYRGAPSVSRLEPLRLALLAQAGRIDSVTEGLEWLREETERTDLQFLPSHVPGIVEGALAVATGDHQSAVEVLAPNLEAERQTGSVLFFVGTHLLARAEGALDRPERALQALETASQERHRAIPQGPLIWLWIESRRAETARRLGRDAEARQIEARLSELLRLADPDFPIRASDGV